MRMERPDTDNWHSMVGDVPIHLSGTYGPWHTKQYKTGSGTQNMIQSRKKTKFICFFEFWQVLANDVTLNGKKFGCDVTAQLSGLFLTLAPPPLASRAQAGEVPPAGKSTLTLAQRHFAPSSVNSSKHSQLPKLIRYRLAKSEIRYLTKKLLH